MNESIEDMLIRHEGMRLHPYQCTAGKTTIGVGRNLDDNGITYPEAMTMLDHDVARVTNELMINLPFFSDLDDVRQAALIDMCFNMGISRLKRFKKMLWGFDVCDFGKAADEAQDSAWFKQVGTRAVEVVAMIRHG